MKYKFNVDCIEFTYDEYQYLYSLSCLAPFTPTQKMFQVFNNSHGHMSTNCLHNLIDELYGNFNVSTAFLHENFRMIKLAHAAMDNSNIKFMHDLMEMLFPGKEIQ